MKKALEIQGISKQYRIAGKEHFLALDNINLDLEQGEVLGLIGANGAGKSTLLKILSRITAPTKGQIKVHGKMASLLEVGTGFHPELSGRENIHLNGSILGMSRASIKARFDEIVEFAGVSRFLDMPVKRYSSGMFVRLAFSVAAHLDSDILLIDEVLAVGDADFQKKCLARMEDISKAQARSIVFVSHNMGAINSLCDRVAWINQGILQATGAPNEMIEQYLGGLEQLNADSNPAERTDREGDGRARFQRIEVKAKDGSKLLKSGESLLLNLAWESSAQAKEIRLELHLFNSRGNYLSSFQHQLKGDLQKAQLSIPELPLMAGRFFFNAHIYLDGIRADFLGRACYFEVLSEEWQQNEVAVQRQNPGVEIKSSWQS
ncbi:polysaccharide ABC transporter ATP-binding protein [Croceimicrobium sp.]|uniref:ABC transporter ATP-binding protein n=1 Tax=Croceimicrobium sp. TaxID=2828340 RepID=UPI003BAAA6A4